MSERGKSLQRLPKKDPFLGPNHFDRALRFLFTGVITFAMVKSYTVPAFLHWITSGDESVKTQIAALFAESIKAQWARIPELQEFILPSVLVVAAVHAISGAISLYLRYEKQKLHPAEKNEPQLDFHLTPFDHGMSFILEATKVILIVILMGYFSQIEKLQALIHQRVIPPKFDAVSSIYLLLLPAFSVITPAFLFPAIYRYIMKVKNAFTPGR